MASTAKRKASSSQNQTITVRSAPYTYLHLSLDSLSSFTTTSNAPSPLDNITVYSHISSALSRFLGIHGTAIQFDILKTSGNETWIRTASQDSGAIVAALAQWSSGKGEVFRVRGRGAWLGGIVGADRERGTLFELGT